MNQLVKKKKVKDAKEKEEVKQTDYKEFAESLLKTRSSYSKLCLLQIRRMVHIELKK